MKYLVLFVLFLAACATTSDNMMSGSDTDDMMNDEQPDEVMADADEMMDEDELNVQPWRDVELTDVNSGETFRLGDIPPPYFIESFAVWCPTCTRQQIEFKKYHENNPEIQSINLATDPNENEALVRDHAESNGFGWKFAVSPPELTVGLIQEFGAGVVNAPAVPVILVCEDSARLLSRGIKDATDLDAAVASC